LDNKPLKISVDILILITNLGLHQYFSGRNLYSLWTDQWFKGLYNISFIICFLFFGKKSRECMNDAIKKTINKIQNEKLQLEGANKKWNRMEGANKKTQMATGHDTDGSEEKKIGPKLT
jgi:hypothetical protein